LQVWPGGRGNLRRIRETVAFGNLDAEHCQLAMNPGCTPQRVAASIHSMKSRISTAEPRTCGTVRAASGRPCRLGRKPGSAPASPQQGQPHPEQSVEASQCGSLPFSLEGNELNAESSVLHRDGAMTTEEESQQTKQRQDEGRHEPRYLVFPALKVKSLPTTDYWRATTLHRDQIVGMVRRQAARDRYRVLHYEQAAAARELTLATSLAQADQQALIWTCRHPAG
jgi:hypothetical protein